MTMNTEKRTARVFTPEQKFEILKDIEKQESVKAGLEKYKTAPGPMCSEELVSWSQWALSQAAGIDLVVNGSYKIRPTESTE
jgi:hypothetical protein